MKLRHENGKWFKGDSDKEIPMPNPKPTSEERNWEEEFDEKLSKLKGGIMMLNKTTFVIDNFLISGIKDYIRTLIIQKQKEVLDKIKEGTICLNCGKPKVKNLSDWCDKCLEEE
jgi:hypothetical protein